MELECFPPSTENSPIIISDKKAEAIKKAKAEADKRDRELNQEESTPSLYTSASVGGDDLVFVPPIATVHYASSTAVLKSPEVKRTWAEFIGMTITDKSEK